MKARVGLERFQAGRGHNLSNEFGIMALRIERRLPTAELATTIPPFDAGKARGYFLPTTLAAAQPRLIRCTWVGLKRFKASVPHDDDSLLGVVALVVSCAMPTVAALFDATEPGRRLSVTRQASRSPGRVVVDVGL